MLIFFRFWKRRYFVINTQFCDEHRHIQKGIRIYYSGQQSLDYITVHVACMSLFMHKSHLYLDMLRFCPEESPVITLISQIPHTEHMSMSQNQTYWISFSPHCRFILHIVELLCSLDLFCFVLFLPGLELALCMAKSLDIILKIDHSREFIFSVLNREHIEMIIAHYGMYCALD